MLPAMGSRQFPLTWASFSITVLFGSMVLAQETSPIGPSIPLEYCSTVNTGDMVPLYYNWQSEGRCFDNCTSLEYAFGIIQKKNCWCSNLIPHRDDRKPLEDCQFPCPGFPTDYCGGNDVFAYLEAAGATPTGTAPPGGTATKSPSSTTSSESVSKPPSMTTITVGGTVRTVTAPSEPTATNDPSRVDDPGSSLQPGAIAGIVIGVIGGLAVIAVAIWFCFFKRRREHEEHNNGLGSPIRGGGSPRRMTTPGSGEVSENRFAGTPGSSAAAAWDSQNKRRSHLMPVDPRLDPFATGMYPDQNRSRESFNSLQDNQDYSRRVHQPPRVLRAMNPDPDD